ncbi:MAG TPA: secretin, partial [Cupriavidus sp.]|nr:secretin [Cupriavidus sp.]
VKPMQTQNYPLPTDGFTTPDPLSLYFMGNMEGKGRPAPQPAPAPSQPAAPATAPAPVPSTPRSETGPTTSVPTSPTPIGKLLDEPAPSAPAASPAPVATVGPRPPQGPARDLVAATPPEDNSARVARIEATALRLAQARAGAGAATTSGTTGSN